MSEKEKLIILNKKTKFHKYDIQKNFYEIISDIIREENFIEFQKVLNNNLNKIKEIEYLDMINMCLYYNKEDKIINYILNKIKIENIKIIDKEGVISFNLMNNRQKMINESVIDKLINSKILVRDNFTTNFVYIRYNNQKVKIVDLIIEKEKENLLNSLEKNILNKKNIINKL